jgi:two-component system, OmpR family, sensor kinase
VTLRLRLLLALAYVLLLAIVAVQVPLAINLRHRVDSEARLRATSQADVTAVNAASLLGRDQRAVLRHLVATAASSSHGHVMIVNPAGHAIADSGQPGSSRRDESRSPEIAAALRGRRYDGIGRRNGREAIEAASPILVRGTPAGAVVISEDIASVRGAVRGALIGLALLGVLVLLVGLGAGAIIAGQLARPLRRLDAAARQIAGGDLDVRAPVEGTSEQRSLARSFNEMTNRLARLVRSQQDFVADASHELRTPLAGLQLRLEEARAAGMTPDADHEVEAGLREVARLAHTVDELLVLSRAGERDAPGERVDLGEQAALAVERWLPRARERGIDIVAREGDPPAAVWCAPIELARAIDALVENAIDYSRPGTTVTIGVASGDATVALEVLDRGPGLDDNELGQVFERFRRGHAGRARLGGSGLGLPIARELARRWRGEATLDNRPEGGARAAITLPSLTTLNPPEAILAGSQGYKP